MSRENSPINSVQMYGGSTDGDTSADESACSAASMATTSSTSSLISSSTTQSQGSSGRREQEWVNMSTDDLSRVAEGCNEQLDSSPRSRSNSESSVESFVVLENEPEAEDKPLFTVSRPLIIAHDSYALAGPCAVLEPEDRARLFLDSEEVMPSPSQDDNAATESTAGESTDLPVIDSCSGPCDSKVIQQLVASPENSELEPAPVLDGNAQNFVQNASDHLEVTTEPNVTDSPDAPELPKAPEDSSTHSDVLNVQSAPGDELNLLEPSGTSEGSSTSLDISQVSSIGDEPNVPEPSDTSEGSSSPSDVPHVPSDAVHEPNVVEPSGTSKGSNNPLNVPHSPSNTEDEASARNVLSVANEPNNAEDQPDASAALNENDAEDEPDAPVVPNETDAEAEDELDAPVAQNAEDVDAPNELNSLNIPRARQAQPNGWVNFGRSRRMGVMVLAMGVLIGVGLHSASRQNEKLAVCKADRTLRNAAADSTIKSLTGQVNTLTHKLRVSQLQLRRALRNSALRKRESRATQAESVATADTAVHAYDELNSTDPAEVQSGNILLPIISEHHPQWILPPVLVQQMDNDPPVAEETQQVAISMLNESDFGFFNPNNHSADANVHTATTILLDLPSTIEGVDSKPAPNATNNANDSAQSASGSHRTLDAAPVQETEETIRKDSKNPDPTQDADHTIAVQRFFAKAQYREEKRQLKQQETARTPWYELRRQRARRSRTWKQPPKAVTFANEAQTERDDEHQEFTREQRTYTHTHAHAHAHGYAHSGPHRGDEWNSDESWIRRCKHCKMPNDQPSQARS